MSSVLGRNLDAMTMEYLRQIGLDAVRIVQGYIKKYWYDDTAHLHGKPSPSAYLRSYDYINCVSLRKVIKVAEGMFQVEIFLDTNKIRPLEPAQEGDWGRHIDTVTYSKSGSVNSVAAMIPSYIEYGNFSPAYSYDGTHPIQKAREYFRKSNYHVKRMQSLLNQLGYPIILTGYVL